MNRGKTTLNTPEMPENLLVPVSDYILAYLRKHLGITHEFYLKWYLAGAYNGAAFTGPDVNIQIAFFQKKKVSPTTMEQSADSLGSYTIICKVDQTLIDIMSVPEKPDVGLCDVISTANARAVLLASQSPEWMSRWRLIQMSCLFEASTDTAGEVAEDIARVVGRALGSEALVSPPQSDGENGKFYSDFGFPLPESLTQEQARGKLVALFPSLALPLSGWGGVVINHDGQEYHDSRLKWTHIYGRHFFEPSEP